MTILEGIFNESRNYFVENRTCSFQTWIRIYLDKPYIIILVNHEIHPKYLKIIHSSHRVDIKRRCFDRISSNLFHFGINQWKKVKISILFAHIGIKIFISYLISFFISTIIRQVFLNCVISQMDSPITGLQSVLRTCCSNVSLSVPITFYSTVAAIDHYVMS